MINWTVTTLELDTTVLRSVNIAIISSFQNRIILHIQWQTKRLIIRTQWWILLPQTARFLPPFNALASIKVSWRTTWCHNIQIQMSNCVLYRLHLASPGLALFETRAACTLATWTWTKMLPNLMDFKWRSLFDFT